MFEWLSSPASGAIDHVKHVGGQLLAPALRLGVTGLARSGKTVFITSLVHNLLTSGRLPFFDPQAQGRIRSVYLEPQPDYAVPRFDYEGNLAKLTGPDPTWPESTRAISQLRVTIEFEPIGTIWRALGTSRLHLDIVDYPGEWLLDLPLLDMSFETWSHSSIGLSRETIRAGAALDWSAFVASIDPLAPQDEQLARKGAGIFTAYLHRCRAEILSLSSLPPGRFLMPGDLEGSPAVTFFPLDVPPGRTAPRDSLWAMMARRFEAYKTHVVKPFFRDHFARLDRQIVLADVLTAVNAGADAVIDLERALTDILKCFRQGPNSWLSVIMGRRIDRIVFAATKADHLHHHNHDRLEGILKLIAEKSIERATFSGAEVRALALASVRSTREGEATQGTETLPLIIGTPLSGERLGHRVFDGREELAVFPGDLPENASLALSPNWRSNSAHFVRFRPPKHVAPEFGKSPALAHIRLDRALNFLLADKLS